MKNIISVSHLYKTFPPHRAACVDTNFTVDEGELVGVVGPNGSGKTTLLRILATILLPDQGSVHIRGLDVTKDTPQIHRLISYLSGENKNFYLRMTGRQNLEFFAVLYGLKLSEARRKIEELGRWFKIIEYLDTMMQQYSSGIMQRCHLVRGLLSDAPILFWDEPTKNLDEFMVKELRDFIKSEVVSKKKKTMIMTSHHFSQAIGIADKIAILHNGRLKAFGSLDDLKNNVPHLKDDPASIYQFYLNQ